ncbi:hypothetical protein [Agrococcus sp. Marseille-Q4369]|uniref:hypothetical protein n=1 Tax=Agrococcus sp. Marseille-Q4369 TaxID=2810513 RepID=UPI001B8C6F24|nr:hypothetical protein [Agrococcus sp. Marseille-Q4369]QUW17749.1 hypothetical protein JSQ78_07630 [Agrococcus sp. Marseille-Q4369]
MTQLVGDLSFPHVGYLESRRGPIVEIRLSHHPIGQRRTYLRVPEGAGEIPAGVYSTAVKRIDGVDEDGWFAEIELERERPDGTVRTDATRDDEWRSEERGLYVSSSMQDFLPQEPPLEREGEQPVNPYGLWALDPQGEAFLVDAELDDAGGLVIEPATRFGKSLHPWTYRAAMPDGLAIDETALDDVDALVEVQLYDFDGSTERVYELWQLGARRAIERSATQPLPDFDPGVWMRWLTPVDGGNPVAFGGFMFPGDRVIELQPVMPVEPEWATGRVLTIPMPRPGIEFEDRREVTVYGKPFKELRSSVPKIQKRPPTPLGRFVLEAEGYMPPGWSALG